MLSPTRHLDAIEITGSKSHDDRRIEGDGIGPAVERNLQTIETAEADVEQRRWALGRQRRRHLPHGNREENSKSQPNSEGVAEEHEIILEGGVRREV